MATDTNVLDSIEPCRTCGVFFMVASNCLRHMYASDAESLQPIRNELAAWQMEVHENDGYPQYICTGCIYQFQIIFKFRKSCIEAQQQIRDFCVFRNINLGNIKVKTELPEENCDFIYVDDISDTECDEAPFSTPHTVIKKENEPIEGATVPIETPPAIIDTATCSAALPTEEATSSIIEYKQSTFFSERIENDTATAETLQEQQESIFSNAIDDEQWKMEVTCDLCRCVSSSPQLHRIHIRTFHQVRDMSCYICGKLFKNCSAARLKSHKRFHKLYKHIKCAQCAFYCASRITLNEHIQEAHRSTKTFGDGNDSKKHTWQVHENNKTTPLKDQYFSQNGEFSDCITKLSQSPKDLYTTSSTTESFNTEYPVTAISPPRQDLIRSADESFFMFEKGENDTLTDEYDSDSESNVESHNGEQDTQDDISNHFDDDLLLSNQFACAACIEVFPTVEQLLSHQAVHTKKPAFKCHLCGKTFELKFHLNRHMKKHSKAPL